jgi:hypothetical protein
MTGILRIKFKTNEKIDFIQDFLKEAIFMLLDLIF